MDKVSIERLQLMHPKLRAKAIQDYTDANKLLGKGVRLRITYSLRTFAEQHQLFLKRPKVTNADAGQSIHNYGLAFDIVMLYDKNGDGVFEEASYDQKRDGDKNGKSDWRTVIDFLISRGWFWGGNFKTLFDAPHFQYDYGYTWQKLLAKHNKKDFIKGTTYVNI